MKNGEYIAELPGDYPADMELRLQHAETLHATSDLSDLAVPSLPWQRSVVVAATREHIESPAITRAVELGAKAYGALLCAMQPIEQFDELRQRVTIDGALRFARAAHNDYALVDLFGKAHARMLADAPRMTGAIEEVSGRFVAEKGLAEFALRGAAVVRGMQIRVHRSQERYVSSRE